MVLPAQPADCREPARPNRIHSATMSDRPSAVRPETGPAPAVDASPPASFDQAMAELERIVASMEAGETPLDECVARYERAVQLQAYCRQALADAQRKITILTRQASGITTEQVDPAEFDQSTDSESANNLHRT